MDGNRTAGRHVIHGFLQLFAGHGVLVFPIVVDAAVIDEFFIFVEQVNVRRALGAEMIGDFLAFVGQIRKIDPPFLDLKRHLVRSVIWKIRIDVGIDGHGIDPHPLAIFGQTQ